MIGKPPKQPRESAEKVLIGRDTFTDPVAATRLCCGALLLPTAAMLVGRCLFSRVSSNLNRTILGGLTFVVAKGMLRIYLRQQLYIRYTRRVVCDWSEESAAALAAREAADVDSASVHDNNDLLDALAEHDDYDDDPIMEPINRIAARDE